METSTTLPHPFSGLSNDGGQLLSTQLDGRNNYGYDGTTTDEDQYTTVWSRRKRRRLRTVENQSYQQQSYTVSGQQRSQQGQQRAKGKPLLIGSLNVDSCNGHNQSYSSRRHLISAIKPILRQKVVLCIDNVHQVVSVDDMAEFINNELSVEIISLYEAKSRKRKNDYNYQCRKAFRLCIDRTDIDRLLIAEKWPQDIAISEWYFKSHLSGEGNYSDRSQSGRYRHDVSDNWQPYVAPSGGPAMRSSAAGNKLPAVIDLENLRSACRKACVQVFGFEPACNEVVAEGSSATSAAHTSTSSTGKNIDVIGLSTNSNDDASDTLTGLASAEAADTNISAVDDMEDDNERTILIDTSDD